jgi:hypothetical protein
MGCMRTWLGTKNHESLVVVNRLGLTLQDTFLCPYLLHWMSAQVHQTCQTHGRLKTAHFLQMLECLPLPRGS